jgi:adenosine kinase
MRVVITGSVAYDYLMSFPGRFSDHLLPDQLHNISVSFLVDSMKRLRGGVAPNIAYTNALLGGRPKIMAAVGGDFEEYEVWLQNQGVDTSGIVIFPQDYCASFFVNTDQDNNQIASFYTGAMANASTLSFSHNAPGAELAIISPNDPEAMVAYVRECKQLDIPYIYDPSQQIIRLSSSELLEGLIGCYLLTVNEYELGMILEKTKLSREDIIESAGGLLVTLAKDGSRIYFKDKIIDIPAAAAHNIVEPTGAGDAYRGGLLRGIQLGLSWEISGRMGALAAAYVLEHVGTQGHSFSRIEFVERYRNVFDDKGALDMLLD